LAHAATHRGETQMSESDPYPSGPQPGDTTYAAYTPGPFQSQPSGYQPQPSAYQSPAPRTGGFGLPIFSLICSLIALILTLAPLHPLLNVLGIVIAIVGIICGHIAMARPVGSKGRGLAIAALVFGYVAFVIGVIHLIGTLLLARFLRRRFGAGALRSLLGGLLPL
jgi:hypothetical protein